jgi:dephospho-CoA kinase
MLKIGLTGGMGSGKSTVAKLFETLGIPVYYADDEAKKLMNEDPSIMTLVKKHFGEESYKHNILDRSYIASIVFNDSKKLETLNSITHPATIQHASEWMSRQKAPYVIKEAALLFESGANKGLDYTIGIYAPRNLRINRVMERDGSRSEDVIKRMNRQMDEEAKMKLCDFVINNNEQDLVVPQVIALHEKFLGLQSPK